MEAKGPMDHTLRRAPHDKEPSEAAGHNELAGDALMQSEEFVEVALACFAVGVRQAMLENTALRKTDN
jgi:hypothetical protein